MLELYDPLTVDQTVIAGQRVPLESDLTTPLAYFLSRPEMNLGDLATAGLLRPDELLNKMRPGQPEPIMGLYMVQPYEPGKIPVLMVHGLWSSPMTWMEMFNDLRAVAGDPRSLPVLVLSLSDRPAVLVQRRPIAARPGRDAATLDPRQAGAGPRPDGAGRPQHGRAGRQDANAGKRRRLLAGCQQGAVCDGQSLAKTCGRRCRRHSSSIPIPAMRRRDHHWHAVSRQPFRQQHHRLGQQQIDRRCPRCSSAAASNCTATTRTFSRRITLIDVPTSIDALEPHLPRLPSDAGLAPSAQREVSQRGRTDPEDRVAESHVRRPRVTAW